MKSWQAESLIFVAACIWGLSYIFTAIGLQFASPGILLTLRFGTALLVTFVFFGCLSLRGIRKKTILRGLFLGSLFGGGYLLQNYAVNFTDISKAAFITALVLPATPFVSWLLIRKPITIWNILGVIIAMAGVYLLVDPKFETIQSGDIIALCSVPLWALYMNYIDIFTTDMEADADTSKMLMLQFIGALPLLFLVVLVFESGLVLKPLHPDMGRGIITHAVDMPYGNPENNQSYHLGFVWLLISIAYLALLGSFVLTFIQTAAQKYTTPVKAMLIFQFEPVIATISAVIVFQEAFTGLKIAGCLVIIGGVLLSELGPMLVSGKKTPEEANPESKSS